MEALPHGDVLLEYQIQRYKKKYPCITPNVSILSHIRCNEGEQTKPMNEVGATTSAIDIESNSV